MLTTMMMRLGTSPDTSDGVNCKQSFMVNETTVVSHLALLEIPARGSLLISLIHSVVYQTGNYHENVKTYQTYQVVVDCGSGVGIAGFDVADVLSNGCVFLHVYDSWALVLKTTTIRDLFIVYADR